MICTAPFFYEEHSHPLDFYRYTQFGFRHQMDVAGFKIERLDWMEGYFGTVAYQLETAFKYLPSSPSQIAPGIVGLLSAPLITFARGLFWVGAQGFYRLDVRTKYTERGFPKNYVLITYKPQSGLVPADGGT